MIETCKGEAGRCRDVLALIADGLPHSGSRIAGRLGVSRTAIWTCIESLRAYGLEVRAGRGVGYQLGEPLELLDANAILANLSDGTRSRLRNLTVLFVTDSTSDRLLALARQQDVHGQIALAETQTAGRGRRGRQWLGGIGQGIYLSLAWRFAGAMESLSGLSLIAGIAVARALRSGGVTDGIAVKWPNDVLHRGRKIAGVLIDIQGEMTGPCLAVIGIGLNTACSAETRARADTLAGAQALTDLRSATDSTICRNGITALLIDSLLASVCEFSRAGFRSFSEEWKTWDALSGQTVTVQDQQQSVNGTARGVDLSGALMVEVDGMVNAYRSGEVSIRRCP